MKFLSDIRIKNKIIIIIMIIGAFSTIIGNVINYIYEVQKSKERLILNTTLQAKLISEYCGLPFEFNYPDNAVEVLEKLNSLPDISAGILFTQNDSIFASYYKSEKNIQSIPAELKNNNYYFEENHLHIKQPVIYKGKNYGYIYLRSVIDWESIITKRLLVMVIIIVMMLIIIFILAYILQKSISNPIVTLTEKMNFVAKNKDYSIKFSNSDKDEIGELYSGFNNMLSEIKIRESNLKETFESLKLSEERFRSLIQKIPFPIVLLNSYGVITLRNDRFVHDLGYSESDVPTIAEWWQNAYPNEQYRQLVINSWENSLKQAKKENSDIEPIEYNVTCKNGEIRIFEISGIILKEGILVTFIELTDRKRAEESLKQSEKRFRELFDEAPVGYHEIDKNGKIIKINNTELGMLQFEDSEMLNHFIWEFIVEDEISRDSIIEKLHGKGSINKSYERTFRRKDRSTFFGLLEDVTLKDESGNIIGIRTTVQDISVQKHDELALHESNIRLEKTLTELMETQKMVMQQERMRALGQLASGIAHDINNSLSPILGYSDMLLDREEIVKFAEKPLTMIKSACLDIRNTIDRMKEFYRPKIEQEEFANIELNKIIASTIDLTRHKWKNMAEQQGKVIKINTELKENLDIIKGNESEIREAITNIILNAVDAMPGGGMLTIKSYSSDTNVIIKVHDTGVGMSKETLNHCMDPFFTTKGDKGTGLGLSMVYGIMQRHSGSIEIESGKDKGTNINLIFPIGSISTALHEKKVQTLISQLKILYIDDDKNMREMISDLLTTNNHQVFLAEDGKTGLEIFFYNLENGDPFDIVITDLGMPYMDGTSVAASLKNRSPEIPVILLTGWGSFIEEGSIKCVDYILKKPVTMAELNKALSEVLKLK